MARGIFITLEGGEGAGKSSLQKALLRRLKREGRSVVKTREPGGTPLGRKLRRELLKSGWVAPTAELLLYAADRAQHVASVIRPALEAGAVVVCDRFSDSTVAYQGYGRRLDRAQIAELNALAQDGIEPDLTLWLDIPVADGLARTRKRGAADRLEAEAIAFHERVRRGFRALSKEHPGRIVRLDARKSQDQVEAAAWAVLSRRLGIPHGL
jgi:dTMP kinase